MHKNHSFKLLALFFFLFVSNLAAAQTAYKIQDIPDPKKNGGGWVSNPDGILSTDDVANINGIISRFESETNVQAAVVIVNDFDHDQEDFDFAYELFNTWGIGQKTSNNGLLLFISKDRKKYRFITGTGAEGILPDVKLKHIAEQNLIPAFRKNDFGTGIINTINAIGIIILNPENKSELNQFFTQHESSSPLEKFWLPMLGIILAFWGVFKVINKQAKKLPKANTKFKNNINKGLVNGCVAIFFFLFISVFIFTGAFGLLEKIKLSIVPYIVFVILAIGIFFRYSFYISELRNIHNDDKNYMNAVMAFQKKNWWLFIISPIILIPAIFRFLNSKKTTARFKPILDSKNQEMIWVDRDINIEGKPFLSGGQRAEEVVKAYDYDIWESADHKEHIIKAWPAEEYKDYNECPSCRFRTFKLNKIITVTAATYSHDGQAKQINECSFCKKTEFIKWITLAMLVESSSSSSSSSSNSSSSSSSSSSSWGGGSSSGGGTGGTW